MVALVHRDEILEQTSKALTKLGIRHGVIAAGYPETRARVQVASVMTLARRLPRIRPPSLIWIDEAHHAAAKTWRTILDRWAEADVFGTTATPCRLDGKPLGDIFDHLICGPDAAALIDQGWLAPIRVFTPAESPDLSRVAVRAGDYAVEQMSTLMSQGMIISGVVDEYQRLCPNTPAIAFCIDILHSQLVAETFRERGYRAEHLDGETPHEERRALIAALANGDIDVLCNCALISEGLDVPAVEAAILVRPTKSLALYLQMVGRALRPGKKVAYVLDHAGNVARLGLPTARRPWTLHGRQIDGCATNGLRRCPQCGAINEADREFCAHCDARLKTRQSRTPRLQIASPRLVENHHRENQGMCYLIEALRWALDAHGPLRRERLELIAQSRGYSPAWVWHNRGKSFDEALRDVKCWYERERI